MPNVDSVWAGTLIWYPVNHTGQNPPKIPETKAVAIIPARYDSTRLPGKALREIAGKPMICRVAERALAARNIARVIVATDDQRIFAAAQAAGFEAAMTRADHTSGTDRIAEVAANLTDFEIVVNVQGDEPLIAPETIERAVAALANSPDAGISTTWEPMESVADVMNPDVVKIVMEGHHAVYFSRSPVPLPHEAVRRHGTLAAALAAEPSLLNAFRKHTGLYVYRRDVLPQFTRWPQTDLEKLESLEQLRALAHGVQIVAVEAARRSIGVDTQADLERVRKIVEEQTLPVPA